MKRLLKMCCGLLLGAVPEIGALCLGARMFPCVWAKGAAWGCIALMLAWLVVDLAHLFRRDAGEPVNVVAERERNLQLRQSLERDPEPERAALNRMAARIWRIWAVWLVLTLMVGFFLGAGYGFATKMPLLFCLLLGVFVLTWMLAFGLSRPKLISVNPRAELSRSDFPELFAMVDEAAAERGHRRRIRVFIGDESIGVFRERRFDGLLLPPILTAYLTKGELRQVLRHELSHLASEDSKMETRWMTILARRDCANAFVELSWIGCEPVLKPLSAFEERLQRYRSLVEHRLEREADSFQMTEDQARQAVAAIAKAAFYARFGEEDNASTFRCYAPKKPEPIVTSIRRAAFEQMLAERGQLWLEELECEIPGAFDSHPAFSQRRRALGVEEYNPFDRETDAVWLAEMEKLCAREDECCAQDPEYGVLRERFYLKRREAMELSEQTGDPVHALPMEKLIEAAAAWYGLDTPRAMELLRGASLREPDNLQVKLMLGEWLLAARDDGGLELLYQAAENFNYAAEALSAIGEYVHRRGMREAVKEYQARAGELLQRAENIQCNLDSIRICDLRPRTMPDERLDELVSRMVELGGGKIAAIGCAAMCSGESDDAHVFVLKFADSGDEQRNDQIMEAVFDMLDRQPGTYALRDESDIPLKKLEKAIPGSCVYAREANPD